MATQIEFDLAMKTLLTTLEEKGKLDDTLIVISPDHYPYGLTKEQLNERSTSDRRGKFENNHTALIIYNPNIEKTVINIAPEAQYGKTRADADEIIRTITTEEGGEN